MGSIYIEIERGCGDDMRRERDGEKVKHGYTFMDLPELQLLQAYPNLDDDFSLVSTPFLSL